MSSLNGLRKYGIRHDSMREEIPILEQLLVALYRGGNKGLYVVARNFFLVLLNFSAWPCLGAA